MDQVKWKMDWNSTLEDSHTVTNIPATDELLAGRAALIIAHPGHELCLYGWCALTRPLVLILTDGSGHSGRPRTDRSTRLLGQLGCTMGSISGRFTDKEVYSALLDRNTDLFTELAREVGNALVLDDVDYAVGDAGEGFNPVHDVCRLIVDAAVRIASGARRRNIPNFEFRLDWRKGKKDSWEINRTRELTLDQETFTRKLAAARGYSELEPDVAAAVQNNGVDRFRRERLNAVFPVDDYHEEARVEPYYEEYGEKQIAAGIYDRVIRYREHLAPVAEALERMEPGDL